MGNQWIDQDDPGHNDVRQRTTTEHGTSSSGCVSQDSTHRYCLECAPNLWLWQGRCEVECPNRTFPTLDPASHIPVCSWCHYSCKYCSGPNDFECTDCFGDATFYKTSASENFCYPKTLLPSIDSAMWYQRTVIVFIIAILLFFVIIGFLVVNTVRERHVSKEYKILKTTDER